MRKESRTKSRDCDWNGRIMTAIDIGQENCSEDLRMVGSQGRETMRIRHTSSPVSVRLQRVRSGRADIARTD